MIVTKLTEQVRDKNRINIFIDNTYSFSLTLRQLLDAKIKIGMKLETIDVVRLKKISEDGKQKNHMLEWLMSRPHSEKELRDYLRRKQVDQLQIDAWVAEMQQYGYQNEQSFTTWWIEQRRRKNRSDMFIAQELRNKGIAQTMIAEALSAQLKTDTESLKEVIEKKRQHVRYQDEKKLIEYLLRQGFRYSDIKEGLAAE